MMKNDMLYKEKPKKVNVTIVPDKILNILCLVCIVQLDPNIPRFPSAGSTIMGCVLGSGSVVS